MGLEMRLCWSTSLKNTHYSHEPDSQRVVHVHKLFIDAQIQDASHGVQRVEKALL